MSNTNGDLDHTCVDCAAGTFVSTAGATACIDCAVGTISNAGAAACVDCAPGKSAAAGTGATKCSNCAAGKISAAAGTACTACTAENKQYQPESGKTACLECPTCDDGLYLVCGGASTECGTCSAGKYFSPSETNERCTRQKVTQVFTGSTLSKFKRCEGSCNAAAFLKMFEITLSDSENDRVANSLNNVCEEGLECSIYRPFSDFPNRVPNVPLGKLNPTIQKQHSVDTLNHSLLDFLHFFSFVFVYFYMNFLNHSLLDYSLLDFLHFFSFVFFFHLSLFIFT